MIGLQHHVIYVCTNLMWLIFLYHTYLTNAYVSFNAFVCLTSLAFFVILTPFPSCGCILPCLLYSCHTYVVLPYVYVCVLPDRTYVCFPRMFTIHVLCCFPVCVFVSHACVLVTMRIVFSTIWIGPNMFVGISTCQLCLSILIAPPPPCCVCIILVFYDTREGDSRMLLVAPTVVYVLICLRVPRMSLFHYMCLKSDHA